MLKFSKYLLAALAIMPLATGPSLADEHGRGHGERRGGVERGHNERWHGDIHRFHERDIDLWRGGRWHHGRHEGRLGWWWIVAGAWYFYPGPIYPYPDPYLPPVTVTPPPVPGPVPAAPQYWYYCPNPSGYYPYVPQCTTNWQRVPASVQPDIPPG